MSDSLRCVFLNVSEVATRGVYLKSLGIPPPPTGPLALRPGGGWPDDYSDRTPSVTVRSTLSESHPQHFSGKRGTCSFGRITCRAWGVASAFRRRSGSQSLLTPALPLLGDVHGLATPISAGTRTSKETQTDTYER